MEQQGGSVLATSATEEVEANPQDPSPQPPAAPIRDFRSELAVNVDRTLDAKGRLVIPAPVRTWFDDGVFILPWAGPSVALFPTDVYRAMEQSLRTKQRETMSDPNAHLAFTALATHALPDSQGRIFIAESTRTLAKLGSLGDDLLVVGRMNRLELWTAGNFQSKVPDLLTALEAQIFTEAL